MNAFQSHGGALNVDRFGPASAMNPLKMDKYLTDRGWRILNVDIYLTDLKSRALFPGVEMSITRYLSILRLVEVGACLKSGFDFVFSQVFVHVWAGSPEGMHASSVLG